MRNEKIAEEGISKLPMLPSLKIAPAVNVERPVNKEIKELVLHFCN